MTVINTRIIVTPDGTISTTTPLAAGEYTARIEINEQRDHQHPADLNLDDLPVHDLGPWPKGLSLRRKDMYGDDGR